MSRTHPTNGEAAAAQVNAYLRMKRAERALRAARRDLGQAIAIGRACTKAEHREAERRIAAREADGESCEDAS